METNKKMLNELKALAVMPDEEIDYSDIPEVTERKCLKNIKNLHMRYSRDN